MPPKQPAGPSMPASVPCSCPVSNGEVSNAAGASGALPTHQCYQAPKQNTSMQEFHLANCLNKTHLLLLKTLRGKIVGLNLSAKAVHINGLGTSPNTTSLPIAVIYSSGLTD